MNTYTPEKLEQFRALLEAETIRGYVKRYGDATVHMHSALCKVKIGRKYANVDRGTSGVYMVELETGNIYGIKAYGVIHRGHCFGNLDTINDYDWSEYRAYRKKVVA